jgi:ketosteroid isomerase-like protein
MKKMLGLAVLACLGMAQAYAQRTYDRDVESKIIALERSGKLRAYEGKDLKALDRILDQAFVDVDQDGQVRSKAEVLAYVRSFDSLRFIAGEMVVRVHGDIAIATGVYEVRGVQKGKGFRQNDRFVDTWLNRNGQWIAIAGLSTPTQ